MPESWTIKKLLDWTQGFFQNKKIPSARLDAELLLAHVLDLTRMELYLKFDRPVGPAELKAFKTLITRRAESEPVAYILGEKEFFSRNFIVTRDVLIPRPDSEVLVEKTWEQLRASQLSGNGLEVGVGSGCLAITLLCENPKLQMTACDISEKALAVCAQNAARHGVTERLHIFAADWLNAHNHDNRLAKSNWDFLIANPPYISENEFFSLDPNVRLFEPELALKGGEHGLDFYPSLAHFAKTHLNAGGFVAVEIGDTQGSSVVQIFKDAGFAKTTCFKDYAGQDRVVFSFLE